LNRAWREGSIASDDAWRRVRPFPDASAARIRYLQPPECKRLINASQPGFRELVQAALLTGCRYAELAALTVDDFNADSGTIAIRRSKTGKSRHVVITTEGVQFFSRQALGKAGDALLLPRADGTIWTKSAQARPMRAACHAAKIAPPMSFHGLRHTWASLTVMNGAPLLVVAKNLGHTDTRMVEKHYGHLAPSFIADEIRRAAPRFGIASSPGKVAAIFARPKAHA
jgi:integrase